MQASYTPAINKGSAFNCPICGAYANQSWYNVYFGRGSYTQEPSLEYCICAHCRNYTLWRKGNMIFPSSGSAPLPNPDLPEDITRDYEEARSILIASPRGAAALLRLSIQKLCKHLGEKGDNINEDIGNLVAKGLNPKIQKSLDIVRVIGNDAVHPGKIDLRDDIETATKLFILVNIITEVMITQPKEVDDLFDSLPEEKKKGIEQRDKKASS
ncbi:DUF4145 domain-containing protein [Flavobacterium sp.]|uniref:DUF4145 domain-containing protein n=1 Tax=Flavobacterium sp. TaxID=239 RepID=UPI002FD967C9